MVSHDGLDVRAPGAVRRLLDGVGVHSLFQPIVDLDRSLGHGCADGGAGGHVVVAYEALARGPQGPLHTPDALFGAARAEGLLAELDEACRAAAFQGAIAAGVLDPLTLFVNVEPEVLDTAPLEDLLAIAGSAPAQLRVVVEITERALALRPAELLRTVARIREFGWGIALDDVGADPLSLAFMPLLRPDVVKLDLRLVQERPGPAVAQILNAVNAYAQDSGAVVLAEGIEHEQHLLTARALGATLGQGWMFGRPAAEPVAGQRVRLTLPAPLAEPPVGASPFALLPAGTAVRRGPKPLLVEISKQLEREAQRIGDTAVVASTFQEARHLTPATVSRYRDLADRTGFVAALGAGLSACPVPGVRGADLETDDPLNREWDVVVLGPHFAAALLARDLGDAGADPARTFDFALTYDRATVVAAARALLSRVLPRVVRPARADVPAAQSPSSPHQVVVPQAGLELPEALLRQVVRTSGTGVCLVDTTRPDQPIVHVNSAFERLAGVPAAQVLGRNCRFLQGPDTDAGVVSAIRAAIAAGQEWHGVLLNHRGPRRTPWWNEVRLAPVRDAAGRVVQYLGLQTDVTELVRTRQQLDRERNRSRVRATDSATDSVTTTDPTTTDPLTGLPGPDRLARDLGPALARAGEGSTVVGLVLCDLDGFGAVGERLGTDAADDVLVEVARRLRDCVGARDLLARVGQSRFAVVRPALHPATAVDDLARTVRRISHAVAHPLDLTTRQGALQLGLTASIGVSTSLGGARDATRLLREADRATRGDVRTTARADPAVLSRSARGGSR